MSALYQKQTSSLRGSIPKFQPGYDFLVISDIPHTRRVAPHCSEGDSARCSGTMGAGPTYVERATEGTGCLPARLQGAIDFMRFIAGRTKFAHSLKPSWR